MCGLNFEIVLIMKKVLFGIAIACVAFAFSSCENADEARCWKITYSITAGNSSTEVTYYEYASKNEVDAKYENYENFSRAKVDKSETDCALANMGLTTEK